ncbi:tetratricopeptide repeat protein [Candidatus Woesearchaeota archaeon]|nr:tetratricopeptide repeat protein [Candidatus Woesearchaeota archaeon]
MTMTNEQDKPNIQEDYPGLKSEQDKLILNFNTLKQIIESGAINPDELTDLKKQLEEANQTRKAVEQSCDEHWQALNANNSYIISLEKENKQIKAELEVQSKMANTARKEYENEIVGQKDILEDRELFINVLTGEIEADNEIMLNQREQLNKQNDRINKLRKKNSILSKKAQEQFNIYEEELDKAENQFNDLKRKAGWKYWAMQGNEYAREGNMENAIALYLQAIQLDPDNPEPYLEFVKFCYSSDNTAPAEVLEDALSTRKFKRKHRKQLKNKLSEIQEAQNNAEREQSEEWISLADDAFKEGKYDDSEKYLSEAIITAPDYPLPYQRMVSLLSYRALDEQLSWDEVEGFINKTLQKFKSYPWSPSEHKSLVKSLKEERERAYLGQKRYKDARHLIKRTGVLNSVKHRVPTGLFGRLINA